MYFKHEVKYTKRSSHANDDLMSVFWSLEKLSGKLPVVMRVVTLATRIESKGGKWRKSSCGDPRNTGCWTGSSSNSSCNRDEKPLHTAVRNPRRNERRGKSLAGMAERY